MSLRAIAPGPVATAQDRGRFGFRAFGVPASGPFDRGSAAVANALVGNREGLAVVEMTGFGGIYESESTLAVALAGAPMSARIERPDGATRRLSIPAAATLRPGDRLILGGSATGYRTYLAVLGGWLVPELMGSRSNEAPLIAGQVLPADPGEIPDRSTTLGRIATGDPLVIRILDGPDSARIDPASLVCSPFLVGRLSDRMGVRLEGDPIAASSDPDRLSTPVSPGAIQIADGRPLVLGPACGTMGGYLHVGHVISADLDQLGQARPGSRIQFVRVDLDEARRLDRRYRDEMARLSLVLATAAGG